MSKVKSFKPGKFYFIKWLDHATCYSSWTDADKVKDEDLNCISVGILVKETKTSIYLAINSYEGAPVYSAMMQLLKSTITESRELK